MHYRESTMFVHLIKTVWLLGILSVFTACRSAKQQQLTAQNDYCHPTVTYTYDSTYLPQGNIQAVLQVDTALTKRYSQHDIVMANAIGVIPLMRDLIALERTPSADIRIERLIKRQQIFNRLLVASTQIASVAAELDCEAERANRLATYLDQRDSRRVRRLTLLSIISGAATTVVTALIQANNTSNAVAVSGGVLSASLGGFAAFSSNHGIQLAHQRNLLTDVWTQNQRSTIYPPFVWYVLNEKLFSNSGQYSVSHNIRERWLHYVLDGSSPADQTLYFGIGGNYTADDFHLRANMLNQLQSSVRSINQDLQSLTLNLSQ